MGRVLLSGLFCGCPGRAATVWGRAASRRPSNEACLTEPPRRSRQGGPAYRPRPRCRPRRLARRRPLRARAAGLDHDPAARHARAVRPQAGPPEARPARDLVARVKPGRVVAVRGAPGGPVVARLSSRTEFGSPRTFAVTRSRPWPPRDHDRAAERPHRLARGAGRAPPQPDDGVARARPLHPGPARTQRRPRRAPPDRRHRRSRNRDADRPLRDHRQAPRLRLFGGLRLLHPRALRPSDEPPARLDRWRPPRDPRRLDRGRGQHRLSPRRHARPGLPDALGRRWARRSRSTDSAGMWLQRWLQMLHSWASLHMLEVGT